MIFSGLSVFLINLASKMFDTHILLVYVKDCNDFDRRYITVLVFKRISNLVLALSGFRVRYLKPVWMSLIHDSQFLYTFIESLEFKPLFRFEHRDITTARFPSLNLSGRNVFDPYTIPIFNNC